MLDHQRIQYLYETGTKKKRLAQVLYVDFSIQKDAKNRVAFLKARKPVPKAEPNLASNADGNVYNCFLRQVQVQGRVTKGN